MNQNHDAYKRSPVSTRVLLFVVAVFAAVTLPTAAFGAKSLQERYDETQQKVDQARQKEGVLTTQISSESKALATLTSEVNALKSHEAEVVAKLEAKQEELRAEQHRLNRVKTRLERSIEILEMRLVDMYKTGEPDLVTVILRSNGFDDLVERADYLQAIKSQDDRIVVSVTAMRNEIARVVQRIRKARDAIKENRLELKKAREALEQKQEALAAAKAAHEATLADVSEHRQELEGDLSDMSAQIAEQLGGYVGPIQPGAAGFIWPVSGPVVSGFGWRWGRMHEGVDIAVPAGTAIRAAKSGTIVLASWYGGYGQYTCIDHGGGLSTCYAHQSRFARTGGHVSQGEIIGYVGCTGHCFGDHLHFEVRIGGQPTDPMAYL